MIPRAVLFDLDDTLFDHSHCARTALEAVRASHHAFRAIDPQDFERAHSRHLETLHLEVLAGSIALDAARRERFRRLFADAGHEPDADLVHATAAAYRDGYKRSWQPVPGALALVAAVHAHARVGIVSNNLYEEQIQKIRHCGFERYLSSIVISERAGATKPDPAIFRVALGELTCEPHEAVMVGDSWAADIAGARAAGIRPVWLNRLRRPKPQDGDDVTEIVGLEPADAVLRVVLEGSRAGSQRR